MRRTLPPVVTLVVGALLLAILSPLGVARAQTSEPQAVHKIFLPLVIDASSSSAPAEQNYAADVLAIVNLERARAGCAAITLNARLSAAAQAHSEDMAHNRYFSHDSLDGTTFDERITRAGYEFSLAAENIAAGQTTPAEAMASWMDSPGHRAAILTCRYTEMGLGYHYEVGSPYGHYWTQEFATPLQ